MTLPIARIITILHLLERSTCDQINKHMVIEIKMFYIFANGLMEVEFTF